MNSFVNPNQRGIELPEGCKDLIDALHMSQKPSVVENKPVVPQGFADLESYVCLMSEPSSKKKSLTICCWQHEDKVLLSLIRPKGVLHVMMILNCARPENEKVARAVLDSAGISLAQDQLAGDAGNENRYLIFSAPAIPREAAHLIADLLRKAYRLPSDAPLEFNYSERDPA